MIDTFLSYISHQKAYSEHTRVAYAKDLRSWEYFLREEFDIGMSEARQDHARSWLMHLKRDKQYSAVSIARKLAALRAFYKYALARKLVDLDPAHGLRAPKAEKKLPAVIDVDEMRDLLDADIFPSGWEGARDRLMLEFFYQTGIRRAELIDLSWKDIRAEEGHARIFGKRAKERLVPISAVLLKQLFEYQRAVKSELGFLPDSIFCSSKGKRMAPSVVYKLVNHYLEMTHATKNSPHVLRHSFATHMLDNGADLNAIKELLGHANLAATQVYTHNSIEKVKSVYNQAHPRSHK